VTERKRGKPTRLGEVLPGVMGKSGLRARLDQAGVILNWATIVGPEIAKVTQAISVDRKGVLLVAVTTTAWMNELAMMERELVTAINERSGGNKVEHIRWRLIR
jgi:predicted nucleic acid-binding Zn ribbon protein